MNPLYFLNNKKVWKPHFSNSLPIIDVVTQYRQKIHPKEEYSLKVNNIEMNDSSDDFAYAENFTKIIHEKSNIHFVEWSKHQRVENGKNKNKNYINVSTYRQHYKNEVIVKESPKVITVKKDKKIARKVYLKWSKYSSTYRDDKSDIRLDLSELNRRNFLLKKYFNLWRHQVHKYSNLKPKLSLSKNSAPQGKINRGNSEDNLIFTTKTKKSEIRKRNSELDMLKKVHKSVIEMQKQKIEQQANIIKELHLARIKLEEEKGAIERQVLLRETGEKCDQKLKSKAKFLSMCNLPAKIDPSKYKNSWEFVTKMELRAEERKKRWDVIKERKQQLEEERLEKLRIEDERKRRVQEEEKKRKILQMKLVKQQQEEMRKKQEEERLYMNALNQKASEHYNNLLLKLTFNAFKHFVEMKKLMMKEAEQYYNEKILLYYFTIWKLFYKIQLQRKTEKAEDFHEMLLLKKGFSGFNLLRKQYLSNLHVAIDFNDFITQKNCFHRWQVFVYVQKHEMIKKEALAINFYQNKLSRRSLQCWKKLPQILFQEREKEQRIRLWYNKVQELLPDFQSSSECFS